MKVGISIKLDVTKIDKARLFKGAKGTYLDLTTFIDTDKPGTYGDHGFIAQSVSKEEKEQGVKTPILGNCKVFWGPQESQGGNQHGGYQPPANQPPQNQRPSQGGGYQSPGQPGYNPQHQNTNPAPPGPVDSSDIPF